MKKIVIVTLWFIPVLANAQKTGVKFQTFRNWQNVLLSAKESHKGIFIDAYATWCAPCKSMDSLVYTDSTLAKYLDSNFISIKIQMDQTKEDSTIIKRWYQEANMLREKFKINALPSLIFLSSEGNLLQRSEGYQNVVKLLSLATAANDPLQNYQSQITRYRNGEVEGDDLLTIALSAEKNKDSVMAFEIAKRYQSTWLDYQDLAKFVNRRTLDFLATFYNMLNSSDKVSKYLYLHAERADSAFNYKGYSIKFTDYLITKEMIDPIIKPNGEYIKKVPKWKKIERQIAFRYDEKTANRAIIPAKVKWYEFKKDSTNFVKYAIAEQELRGIKSDGRSVNNFVYEVIFKYSNDSTQLKKGKEYMELILTTNPNRHTWIDTYANVLYKMGRKAEAIKAEEKALVLAIQQKSGNVKEYETNLSKMYKNEPTWSEQ